jgi:hypothetical protein
MKFISSLHQLSNRSLLDEAVRLAANERGATADLIAAIVEVDARRLHLGESCPSMFVYCTRVLHLSEHAGGRAMVENIELRCRAHNAYEAALFFGESSIVRETRCVWSREAGPGTSVRVN